MVDLKALDPDVHRVLTGQANDRVLASLRQLSGLDRLAEVRLLIVPGANDDADELAATAQWLGTLERLPELVVQGFRHDGTRPIAHLFREADADDLERAAATLVDEGLPATCVRIRRPARIGTFGPRRLRRGSAASSA
jgi:pyruvate formate lyase activating enzyme